jgi:polar amino acid transport system substrate-binding protein
MKTLSFFVPVVLFWSAPSLATSDVLRWGADLESGAPYAFKDPSSPDRIIGFEADLVHALGEELGMKVEFYQNDWAGLIQGLNRHDYDIVSAGVEITPERRQVVSFSTPYMITHETLSVRKTTNEINGIVDLKNRRVATLTASVAQRMLSQVNFPLELLTYSKEFHLYNDLAIGRVDAGLLDEPIALYYGRSNSDLKVVGGPIGRLEYGVATRNDDAAFTSKVNTAVDRLIKNGRLRLILENWGLWNELTASAWGVDSTPQTPALAYQEFQRTSAGKIDWRQRAARYWSFAPVLMKGARMTLTVSIMSMMLAMVVGLLVALGRLYGPAPLRWLAVSYVELFRGTPLLIQLYLIFYGLPYVGVRIDPFMAAMLGLGLNYGASEAENYRAGIMSIPKAQMDASQALGMTRVQAIRHIILPQAIRVVIPPVTNDFIALLKDSSLVSVITMVELTSIYGQLASTYFDYLGIGLLTAAVYFLIGLPFVRLSRRFEKNLNAHVNKPAKSSGKPFVVSAPLRLFSAVGKR